MLILKNKEMKSTSKELKGTKFQIKVWNYLKKIRKGTTQTYSDVAIGIKRPKAVRAVASAIGKNPYPLIIPCHRVIRSDGKLGGYSGKGGIKRKLNLLLGEKAFKNVQKSQKNNFR